MKTTLIVINLICFSYFAAVGQISPRPADDVCSITVFEEAFSTSVPTGWTGDFDTIPAILEGWILNSSSTSTSDTGPDGPYEGSHYVYLETSGPAFIGDTYEITSPIISIPEGEPSALSFYVLMHGDEMGELTINAISVAGTTELLKIVGEQHGSSDIANWEEVYINLSDFIDQDIQIQFVGMKGSGDMGDIGLDAINICQLARPIPTLGQWGLLTLSLLLTIFGLTALKTNILQPILIRH